MLNIHVNIVYCCLNISSHTFILSCCLLLLMMLMVMSISTRVQHCMGKQLGFGFGFGVILCSENVDSILIVERLMEISAYHTIQYSTVVWLVLKKGVFCFVAVINCIICQWSGIRKMDYYQKDTLSLQIGLGHNTWTPTEIEFRSISFEWLILEYISKFYGRGGVMAIMKDVQSKMYKTLSDSERRKKK